MGSLKHGNLASRRRRTRVLGRRVAGMMSIQLRGVLGVHAAWRMAARRLVSVEADNCWRADGGVEGRANPYGIRRQFVCANFRKKKKKKQKNWMLS